MVATLLTALVVIAAQAAPAEFAQGVEYRIEARLDEATDVLHGRAELRYTNNAPVPLDTLWFHLHLNAFRPNSAWAQRDLEFNLRRFQDLGPDEHAFERIGSAFVGGIAVVPVYPLSPDSTVVGLPLPSAVTPGATVNVRIDWTARPSTLPRRQGREGRRFDFAQWYPRVAAYDEGGWQVQPLLPQGEFYGEFGSYDVTLEVTEDQVIGATGVPVEGDPGWAGAARAGFDAIAYNRGAYEAAAAPALGFLPATAPAGQKRVRWRAEDVHHFAWSANPEFIYEGGTVPRTGPGGGEIGLHVLYLPGDITWAEGAALRRTATTLTWLQGVFGPYTWPQLTNLHRIEGGGTEFPMMMMNGSPSEGLIMHEGAHQYVHGILANNEFDEGWLDEGFASFLTNWYFEENGTENVWDGAIASVRELERAARASPISLPGADFPDPGIYGAMTYTKASLVFRMLGWMIGDEAMREGLRTFYDRHAMSQVNEEKFRRAMSDAAGQNLDWFFDQWIHTTDQLDYRITDATTWAHADGGWVTRIEVQRAGEAWMPVDLRVGTAERRLNSRERQQVVEVRTAERPGTAILDPNELLLDIDPGNNTRPVVAR